MTSSDGATRRRRLRIEGAVQGVGYRAGCARAAERAGVAGWVRNRPDGTVEAVVEGGAEAVEAVITWCGTGPRGARVDRVGVAEEPPTDETGFSIEG